MVRKIDEETFSNNVADKLGPTETTHRNCFIRNLPNASEYNYVDYNDLMILQTCRFD